MCRDEEREQQQQQGRECILGSQVEGWKSFKIFRHLRKLIEEKDSDKHHHTAYVVENLFIYF